MTSAHDGFPGAPEVPAAPEFPEFPGFPGFDAFAEFDRSGGPALLAAARGLLLDFDGPMCRLFAGHPADGVALRMRELLAERAGIADPGPVRAALRDPHGLLRAARGREIVADLEALLAEQEEVAALSAEPTPGAGAFVRAVADSGRVPAVTTNNAPRAVLAYLKAHGLDAWFGDRVFGRDPEDPSRMKPHPDCLLRAVAALGVPPGDCLMIGDSPADAEAAVAAGVRFLGYARSPDRVARLRRDVPHPVVVGMAPLVSAARTLGAVPGPSEE
ncbi:HAD family hydrolase [Streptomyces sp. HPF1205]|uniref:HAD family hydrolase n=1 Tax=Streptomyces sp. HPF1205 TaxID=2873262 RepID=UPI001CEC71C6|nr:HAD family phosphatase [Streptomyces sp. HPF1205]